MKNQGQLLNYLEQTQFRKCWGSINDRLMTVAGALTCNSVKEGFTNFQFSPFALSYNVDVVTNSFYAVC